MSAERREVKLVCAGCRCTFRGLHDGAPRIIQFDGFVYCGWCIDRTPGLFR